MAVTQSQYNFIRFAANNDALNFKGLLAGLIICKTSRTTIATVRVRNYASQYDIIPQTVFGSAAQPINVINFPEFGIPVSGIKTTLCSNCVVIAMRR